MKNLAPAFQFYASDYLADVNVELLTLEQEGAYIRLLAYCWREGSLPAEPEQLAKLCKGCSTDVITVVQRLFNEAPSDKTRLVHKRLDEERQKQKERREQRSEAGKMSADARKGRAKSSKDPTAVATVVDSSLNETSTLQSSSSLSTNQLPAAHLN